MASLEETPEASPPKGPLSNNERVVKEVSSPATNRLTMDEVFVDGKIDLDLVCVGDIVAPLLLLTKFKSNCICGLLCRGPSTSNPLLTRDTGGNSSRRTSTLRVASRLKWPSA